jgi:hypothetical protein
VRGKSFVAMKNRVAEALIAVTSGALVRSCANPHRQEKFRAAQKI